MADAKFERFGKYLILDHLVDGGMAKICRARFLGEQSNKIVAIKMVQPQFSRDPSFVRMFQDELAVTLGLQHPNIAQTYDYGKVHEQLFTAMEYVDGANLKQFLDRLKEKNYVFPVEISIYIISQVCQGLHYAHTFQDKLTGQPLHMVHRDISPHNIMLTYDGAVKVIDFGIAKSNTNSESTQAGTIKGKLSYLAPEYLEGMELDHRYDQFAVGITLWEMLCSRKLFTAANDLAVLKQIQSCKVTPPSQINPNVSKELDAIVMKALSKDRSQRYEDMDKFNRALVKFLYAQYPDFNPSDLSYFAKELFKDEIKRDKEKFVEYGKIDVQPYIEALKSDVDGNPAVAPAAVVAVAADPDEPQRHERIELDLGVSKKTDTGIELNHEVPRGQTRKMQRPNLAARGGAREDKSGKTNSNVKAADRTGTISRPTRTKINRDSVAEAEEGSSGKLAVLVVAGLLGFAYFQPDFVEEMTGVNLPLMIHGPASPNREPAAPNRPSAARDGRLSFGGVSLDMEVWINGKQQSYGLGQPLQVAIGRPLAISVRKAGHKSFVKTITLTDEKASAFVEVPTLEPLRSGLLSSSMNYPTGSVLEYVLDGETIQHKMPFKDVTIPRGEYQATVVNPSLGTAKPVKFTIEENKVHLLE
jgi:serine/threonine protein kinase